MMAGKTITTITPGRQPMGRKYPELPAAPATSGCHCIFCKLRRWWHGGGA